MKNIYWILLLFSYLVYHLVTLGVSPLPWLDEAQFSSITHSFAQFGTLYEKVTPLDMDGQEITIYGPVYFAIAGMIERLLGFGMLPYRLLPLICGFVNILLAYLIFISQYKTEFRARVFFLLLLLLDPIMNASMHGGRMDLMASSFLLASVFFFLKLKDERPLSKSVIYASLSGLLASAAMLTTPRSGILLISVGLIALFRFFRTWSLSRFLEGLIWLVVFCMPILLWINHAFLSTKDLMAAFSGLNEGGWHHPLAEYVLLGITAVFVALGMIEKRGSYFSETVLLSLINIVAFYFLIFEVGCYYVFFIPYCYILIACGFSEIEFSKFSLLRKGLLYAALVFNISYFSFKTLVLCSEMDQRSSSGIKSFAKNNIPARSKVVGDQLMYYAVREDSCEFQLITAFKTLAEREWDQRRNFDYDYMLVSDFTMKNNPDIVDYYVQKSGLKKLGRYEFPLGEKRFHIPGTVDYYNSYNATLFKRVKMTIDN